MPGSYEKRNDKYRLIFTYKGKRYTKTIQLKKGQRIERELDKFVEEIIETKVPNRNISFTNFSQKWVDEYIKPNLRERSGQQYIDKLNYRLIPYFGKYSLNEIGLYEVQTFINSLNTKLSFQTIKKYKNCLSCMFNYAIKWGFAKYNPCTGVVVPKGIENNNKPVFLLQDEVKILFDYLGKEELKYQIIVRLAVQCGMRRSEILGLEWNSIDFDNCTINIHQATSSIKGVGTIVTETKTESSKRIIYCKKEILDLIQKLDKSDTLVFKYMHNDTVSKWFRKFLIKNNLKLMRFHDLRHTHATLLIANNVDMKTVSARLGHSNISTTMNIYTHALSENDKKASLII